MQASSVCEVSFRIEKVTGFGAPRSRMSSVASGSSYVCFFLLLFFQKERHFFTAARVARQHADIPSTTHRHNQAGTHVMTKPRVCYNAKSQNEMTPGGKKHFRRCERACGRESFILQMKANLYKKRERERLKRMIRRNIGV